MAINGVGKVETGVPMPGRRHSAFPLRKMRKGDSFVVESRHIAAVQGFGYSVKVKIAVRKIDATHHRVWRIA